MQNQAYHGRRRALAAAGVAAAVVAILPGIAAPAGAVDVNTDPNRTEHFTPAGNRASFWGEDCVKLSSFSDPFELGDGYGLLVLKAGTQNFIWDGEGISLPAGLYATPNGKDISHVIVCPSEYNS
jgi:hypothetical protein